MVTMRPNSWMSPMFAVAFINSINSASVDLSECFFPMCTLYISIQFRCHQFICPFLFSSIWTTSTTICVGHTNRKQTHMNLPFNKKWNSGFVSAVHDKNAFALESDGDAFCFRALISILQGSKVRARLWILWIHNETGHGCFVVVIPSWHWMFTFQNRFYLSLSFFFAVSFSISVFTFRWAWAFWTSFDCILRSSHMKFLYNINNLCFGALVGYHERETFSFCILQPNTIDNLFEIIIIIIVVHCAWFWLYSFNQRCNIDIHYLLLCDYKLNVCTRAHFMGVVGAYACSDGNGWTRIKWTKNGSVEHLLLCKEFIISARETFDSQALSWMMYVFVWLRLCGYDVHCVQCTWYYANGKIATTTKNICFPSDRMEYSPGSCYIVTNFPSLISY